MGSMKLYATIGRHDLLLHDHIVNYKRYITNFRKTTITKLVWNSHANKIIPFLYVMWPCKLLKKTITTKLGVNTYKNEMIAYLLMAWPNHTNVIKDAAPKVTLVEDTNHATWFFIIWYSDKWKEHMLLLQKLSDIKFDRKKTQKIFLFFRFKIYIINAASWNELKLLGR